ncbi:hypothetical protein BG015_010061 [Linnemannia schmuckeri]|uniref:Uncharacterized protein n=1 Tax=Linnemannia schmuckeri TaxID=64567 RepID=A0A9P5V9C6_9FUNG|nr:hypothetical protein BG015_010061 [Linnemannia schmuckeri]
MALLFGRKTAGTKWGTINYARGLVIALYLVSWGFSFIATLLVQTNNKNPLSCNLSIFSCITLYASSKVIIYLFLMEKVYVVTAIGSTRRDFFLYKVNLCLLLPYIAVITLMIIFRHARINKLGQVDPVDEHRLGHCDIGLGEAATYPLIFYDIFVSCWLTFLFIWPLMSSTSLLQGPSKGRLRDVARRTLMGCVMSLIISTGNVASLITSQGWERGLICLSCCTADVTLNAITIHWVTSRGGGRVSGAGRSTRDRIGTANRGTNGISSGYHLNVAEKQVAPLESHMSITVESYVEEYHQMSLARSADTSSMSTFGGGDTASRYITDPLPPTRYGDGVRSSRYIEPTTPTRFEVRSSRYGDPGSSRYTSDEISPL